MPLTIFYQINGSLVLLQIEWQAYVDEKKTTTDLLNEVKAKYAALRR
jgi:hypothetical protein